MVEDIHRFFVYGTLKRGGRNHYGRLAGGNGYAKYLGESSIKGKMYDFDQFPIVVLGGESDIFGEIYEIDDITLENIDALQNYPTLFNRSQIRLENDQIAWVYHIHEERVGKSPSILSGIWKVS